MKAFPIYTFVTVFCCVALLLSCNDVDYLNVEQSFINARISESQLKDESSFVSVEEAKNIANLFFYKQAFANPLSRNDGNKEIDGTPIKVLDEDGSPLMYILNYKNGGFVIISATKDYYPVLAFSDKGSFVLSDQVNGVSIWFNDTKKQIKNSISLNDSIIGTKYGLVGSWTTPSNLVDGLNSLMYNVQKEDYYPYETERYLFDHQKPIIMLGNDTNLSWIPGQGNIEYAGKSHYWVCDGAKHIIPNNLEYFTEWQPYGNGTFVKGWNTIDNPGVLRGVVTTYFSMNWGWPQNDPNDENGKNGWYIDANSGSGNYEHSRVNFYLSKK